MNDIRKDQPGIFIDESGVWHHRADLITNEGILKYFKQNLHRDSTGYYVLNQFENKMEFAYLDAVRGFPLFVTNLFKADQNHFHGQLDSGENRLILPDDFIYFNETTVAVLLHDRNVACRLTGRAMIDLSDYYYFDENGTLHLQLDKKYKMKKESILNYLSE